MNTGFDTSVVIRLLTGDPPDQFNKAKEWMERAVQRGERPEISDLVIVEAYFALQTHYRVPKDEALKALRQLLESGDVKPAGFALGVLQQTPNLSTAKPGFVDRIIHAEIRSHGCQLLTFERSATRLQSTKVL